MDRSKRRELKLAYERRCLQLDQYIVKLQLVLGLILALLIMTMSWANNALLVRSSGATATVSSRPRYLEWNSSTSSFDQVGFEERPEDRGYYASSRGRKSDEWGGRHAIDRKEVTASWHPNRTEWAMGSTEGQDRLVMELMDFKRGGFYIDLAARYWQKGSNTWALDHYLGWKGVCIEPDKNLNVGLLVNRSCAVIINPISKYGGKLVFFNYGIVNQKANHKVANSGSEAGWKTTARLADVLIHLAPRHIDYLSLDIEGLEYEALSTVDFNSFSFSLVSIERPSEKLHALLNKRGYRWLKNSGRNGDMFYISESVKTYKRSMFKFRPNASDYWLGSKHAYLKEPSLMNLFS